MKIIKPLAIALALTAIAASTHAQTTLTQSTATKQQIAAAFATPNPSGYSECTVTVAKFYYGDTGYIWIDFEEGGSTLIAADDVNKVAYLSMLLTAKTANRLLMVRYNHLGATCTASNLDVVGIWFK